MNIPKAIKIQTDLLKRYDFIDAKETHKALQLGIEALKAFQHYRQEGPLASWARLPGEALG